MDGKENVPEKLAGGGKATLSRGPADGGSSNKDAHSWLSQVHEIQCALRLTLSVNKIQCPNLDLLKCKFLFGFSNSLADFLDMSVRFW